MRDHVAWARDHVAWARDHAPDARNHALHAVIFGLMRAYPGVLLGVLGPFGRFSTVGFSESTLIFARELVFLA